MNSLAIKTIGENEVKEGVPTGVLEALDNIKNTMKIRAERGSEEAAFILRHL